MAGALPLVVFAIALCVGATLYIAGCAVTKNWYPMLALFPALLLLFFAYMFMLNMDKEPGESWMSSNSWLFLTVAALVSVIGLPLVFFHCDLIGGKSLAMLLAADVAFGIGLGLYIYMSSKEEGL